jgi:hypothetical protein
MESQRPGVQEFTSSGVLKSTSAQADKTTSTGDNQEEEVEI